MHDPILAELDTIRQDAADSLAAYEEYRKTTVNPIGLHDDFARIVACIEALARIVATHIRTELYMGEHRLGE